MYLVRGLTGINKEYPHARRMFSVMDEARKQPVFMSVIGDYLKAEYPEVEKFVSLEFGSKQIFQMGEKEEKKYMLGMMEVTPSFFDFFSVSCSDTLPQFRSEPNGIVLFESTARRLFGDNRAVGEKLTVSRPVYDETEKKRMDKDFIYTVCGITKDFPKDAYFNLEAGVKDGIILNDERGAFIPAHQGHWSTSTVVMLHRGVSLKAFNEKLALFSPDTEEPYFKDRKIYLSPFSDFFREVMGAKFYVMTGIFGGIGLLVLLIALFNYASYVVSQILEKRHACAIRKTVNAGKWHLLFLFFTEIAITLLMAVFFASIWGELLVPWVNNLFGEEIVVGMSILQQQINQYFAVGLALSFLLCLIPATVLNRTSVKDSLYGGKSKHPKSRAGNILLGFQFFICIIFITAALFLFMQLKYVSTITQHSLTVADKENIFEIDCSRNLFALHVDVEEIKRKCKENPYIEDMLTTDWGIVQRGVASTKLVHEEKELDMKKFSFMNIGSNYVEFTKSKLLEGRIPEEGNYNEILVNRTARKLLGKENVLGEVIQTYNRQCVIVGVLEDEITFGATKEIRAMFFFASEYPAIIYLKVHPAHRKEAVAFIRNTIRAYIPETIAYELPTLSDKIAEINQMENILLRLIGLFAFVSIAISLFGVYSSVLLATERRRKEVAIRKINGAVLSDIIRLFLRTYLYILAIAAVPAFVIVYFVTGKWLETYAYHISTPWLVAPLLLVVLGGLLTLTIIYRLMKTARINPAEVIKN
jgi:ABC-type antimicrobial peptide transport system permease subunit